MKVLRKPIEVIAWFDIEGNPAPLRFRYEDENEGICVIRVNKVLKKDIDRFAGNKMLKYTCETWKDGTGIIFELRYEIDSLKWYLYKM